ncbi:MAG TPA: hypothetical protein ENN32_00490 [Chloroflexi bacterium]|nr:hypothetical protein [Chloroflexota bacterium]
MRILRLTTILFIFGLIISACAQQPPAVQVVETYFNAIVEQNDALIPQIVCEEWQFDAYLEMDSFLAVNPVLEDLSCTVVSEDQNSAIVNCQGSILATYNEEQQKIDLSNRNFIVRKEANEWLLCGQQ